MTQNTLLDRAQAGAPLWEDVPALATCSYKRYKRTMGTAVRITRMAPRGIRLPNPAFGDFTSWPTVRALHPGAEYFHKGLTGEQFRDRYLADLNSRARQVDAGLLALPVEHGRLCLLCFEVDVNDPLTCHRRMFAEWWEQRTGREVPELR